MKSIKSKYNNSKHKEVIKMKREYPKHTRSFVFMALLGAFLISSNGNILSQPKTLTGNDVSSNQLIPIPIEDFEKPMEWKSIATPYDPNKINSYADIKFVDGRPADLGDLPAKKVLGLKYQFRYPGYNFITLFPPTLRNPDGTPTLDAQSQEKIGPALEMPGRTRKISIWVMSEGKDYTLEGYIKDWQGNTHRINFGSLQYIGWRPLIAEIPSSIPQGIGSYPQTKTLKFIKFIIRSTRRTTTEPVFLFFDQLKVLTNKFDVHFDGAEVDRNWGSNLSPVKGLLQATKPVNK